MNVSRLKETLLMNKIEFLEKTVFFLVRPETYWVMCWNKEREILDFLIDNLEEDEYREDKKEIFELAVLFFRQYPKACRIPSLSRCNAPSKMDGKSYSSYKNISV